MAAASPFPAPEGVTDINTIPSALIQRTEIVTGGSSAVYGSDAITGVVNFIMRDDFERGRSARADGHRQRDGDPQQELRPHLRHQFRR
jgi:outer membrane cobalamin receptor